METQNNKEKQRSTYLVIRALNDYNGSRFPIKIGETRIIRYKHTPEIRIRIVNQILKGQAIEWGGATVLPGGYKIVYHGQDHIKANQYESGLCL